MSPTTTRLKMKTNITLTDSVTRGPWPPMSVWFDAGAAGPEETKRIIKRNCKRFAREALGAEKTPNGSQTDPDRVTKEVEDAAKLEVACIKTWVEEEDTRDSIMERHRVLFGPNGRG